MKSILILLFLSLTFFAQAQKGTRTIAVSYGNGSGQIKPMLAKAEMTGSFSEGTIRTFDVNLIGAMSKSAALEIGVSVLNHQYVFKKYSPYPTAPEHKSVNTLVFPIKLRVSMLKYFFISGGILLNDDIGREGSLDLGFGIGAGVQYYFKNKLGFFIYPQTNVHTPTIGLSEKHIAFGLAYKLPTS